MAGELVGGAGLEDLAVDAGDEPDPLGGHGLVLEGLVEAARPGIWRGTWKVEGGGWGGVR